QTEESFDGRIRMGLADCRRAGAACGSAALGDLPQPHDAAPEAAHRGSDARALRRTSRGRRRTRQRLTLRPGTARRYGRAVPADLPAPIADWFAARGWAPRRHQRDMLAAARAGQ